MKVEDVVLFQEVIEKFQFILKNWTVDFEEPNKALRYNINIMGTSRKENEEPIYTPIQWAYHTL